MPRENGASAGGVGGASWRCTVCVGQVRGAGRAQEYVRGAAVPRVLTQISLTSHATGATGNGKGPKNEYPCMDLALRIACRRNSELCSRPFTTFVGKSGHLPHAPADASLSETEPWLSGTVFHMCSHNRRSTSKLPCSAHTWYSVRLPGNARLAASAGHSVRAATASSHLPSLMASKRGALTGDMQLPCACVTGWASQGGVVCSLWWGQLQWAGRRGGEGLPEVRRDTSCNRQPRPHHVFYNNANPPGTPLGL